MNMKRDVIEGIAVIGPADPVQIDINNLADFEASFAAQLEDGDRDVVLDASRVEFFDSAGMGSLLGLQKIVQQRGGRMVVAGLNRSVAEVFHMIGFDMVFAIHPDARRAAESLK